MKNRFMYENTRLIYDNMMFADNNNIPGLLLTLDFEKAFDCLEWKFLMKALSRYNFGVSFMKWITVFYTHIKSCVMVNGVRSDFFDIQRGCRQGDPLSPYLFLLGVEILSRKLSSSDRVRGLLIDNKELRNFHYADDSFIFFHPSEENLRNVFNILTKFTKISGLIVNKGKSNAIWIGSMRDTHDILAQELGLQWQTKQFKVLGVVFSTNLDRLFTLNLKEKLLDVGRLLNLWRGRYLSLVGKIMIMKSLVLPKISFLFYTLPSPPDHLYIK